MTTRTARELVIARPAWGRLGILLPLWTVMALIAGATLWFDPAVGLPVLVPVAATSLLLATLAHSIIGSTIAVSTGGVLLTGHFRQRRPILLPWSEVAAMWLSGGRVFVSPRLGPLRSGGLWPDPVDPQRLRQAVAELSDGRITLAVARPEPDRSAEAGTRLALPPGSGRPPPPLRRRVLRAPLSLLGPVPVLLLMAGVLAPVAWQLRLVSAAIGAALAVAGAIVVLRQVLSARVILDDAGLTRRDQRIPWTTITGLERRRIGPWRRLLAHRGALALPPVQIMATWPPASAASFHRRSELVLSAWRSRGGHGEPARTTVPFWAATAPLLLLILLLPAVAVAATDRPWERSWWPGVELALDIPEPCTAIDANRRAPLVADAQPTERRGQPGDLQRRCSYVRAGALLIIQYDRFEPFSGSSGIQRAAERYTVRANAYDEHPTGIGDEASASTTTGEQLDVEMLIRRANVLILLSYTGPESLGADAHVTLAAQDAVNAIRLH